MLHKKKSWVSVTALLLVACGSEGPPLQEKAELPALSGTATYDETVSSSEVGVKGTAGTPRTASNSTGTNQFKVSLESLTGPYMLRFIGGMKGGGAATLYSVATKSGVSNITPLTTLLTAQLLGQDLAVAYSSFGASGGPRTDLVTDAKIAEAQAKLVTYLQDTLGVTVKSPTASFVTTSFTAAPGDAMFDTIKALDDKLVAKGTNIGNVVTQIAQVAALCIREKIVVNIGGQAREFCPSTKSANPEEAEPAILDYVFTDLLDNTLTVKVTGDQVLSGQYDTAAGATFTCVGAACGGIALGTPNADLTRTLTFTNTDLSGAPAPAVLSGSVLGAIPGIALPILPCDNNKYYVIFQDRTVIGDCTDQLDPLNFGGVLSTNFGPVPSRGRYALTNTGSTYPGMPHLEVVTDANESVLNVYFYELDENFFPTIRYVCQGSACNGITLGALSEDRELLGPDFPIFARDVTFDNTVLAEIAEDGTATGKTATFKAQFRSVYVIDPSSTPKFPDLLPCLPGVDTVAMTPDISAQFNYCSDPLNRATFDHGDDNLQLFATNDSSEPLSVEVHAGAVVRVGYSSFPAGQSYSCSTNCTGITVSPPAPDGTRTVKFEATVLYEDQSFPLPGLRTVTLNSNDIVFPAP